MTVVPHANVTQGYTPWEESLKYPAKHPGPVGAMIDENTVLVLNGSSAEVIGSGNVALLDPARDKARPFLLLKVGAARDVAR